MNKRSSCIAIFPKYADANKALQQLLAANVSENHISLLGKDFQQGAVAAGGLSDLDDELYQLGVQEGNLYCYKCLLHGGSFLLIVSGNYEEMECVFKQLVQHENAEVSIHFNAV